MQKAVSILRVFELHCIQKYACKCMYAINYCVCWLHSDAPRQVHPDRHFICRFLFFSTEIVYITTYTNLSINIEFILGDQLADR